MDTERQETFPLIQIGAEPPAQPSPFVPMAFPAAPTTERHGPQGVTDVAGGGGVEYGHIVPSPAPGGAAQVLRQIRLDDLAGELGRIRDGFAGLVATEHGQFGLTSITLELGLTAEGKVGFIVASGTASASATISVTLGPG